MIETRPASKEAVDLIHDGLRALAHMEHVGICVDVPYLETLKGELEADIRHKRESAKTGRVWSEWSARYGQAANINSRDQLSAVLFDDLKLQHPTGGRNCDDEVLDALAADPNDGWWFDLYSDLQKLEKLRGTYVDGILRHQWDGVLHAVFNLHIAKTFRSTCSDPNLQNIPIRDPSIGPKIRRAFIARPGCHLVEADFSGIEVHAAAWYHKDPTMLQYLATGFDMHKTQAAACFATPLELVSKPMRQAAKGGFVFAQFYGDWFASCALNLWKQSAALVRTDGVAVRDALAAAGVFECGSGPTHTGKNWTPAPGTYMHLIQGVEDKFWNKTFPVYKQWRERHYENYLRTGGIDMLTGFRVEGEMSRNQCINYPVQGAAFHCLLWCLIHINDELMRRGMRSRLVNQIHDSIIGDVPAEELGAFIDICHRVMTKDLPDRFRFICTKVDTEIEVTPVGGCWADKKKYELGA